jgi:hypothetical protein
MGGLSRASCRSGGVGPDRRRETIELLKLFRERQTLDVPVKQIITQGRQWIVCPTRLSLSPGASTTKRLSSAPA